VKLCGWDRTMQNKTDDSSQAYRALLHVLEKAAQTGVSSIELEYEDQELIVYYFVGMTAVGAPDIPRELQQGVIQELVKRAGLSRKSKGRMQVRLLGKNYEVVVKERDSFGESVFDLTLKVRNTI
jgi:type II secretory ATPase GspE/PulE/Tfp pilus assembly ATPase PilB-like protein